MFIFRTNLRTHIHRSILESFTASYSVILCCLSQPQQLPKWASVHFIAWPENKGVFLTIVLLGFAIRQNVQAGSGTINLDWSSPFHKTYSSTSNLDIASCKGTKLQVDYEQPEIDHRLELRRQKRLCEMCQNYETCMLLMCLEATCLRLLRRW